MFQKMINSLTARIAFFTLLSIILTFFILSGAIFWIFEKSLDTQVDNHLTAYSDIFAGAIHIKNGEVKLDKNNALIKEIPRHWQIDTPTQHIAKSSLLKGKFPVQKPISFEPRRVSFKDKNINILAMQQAYNFPNNKVVIITFGLEDYIIKEYTSQLREQFESEVYKVLMIALFILLVLGILQTLFTTRSLLKVKTALKNIHSGKTGKIEGKFPTEIQELCDEINNLLEHMKSIIERYSNFSSNLSHTLKTPLAVIRNEEGTELINKQVDTMLQAIDRNLARFSVASTKDITSSQTNIRDVLNEIAEGFGKIYNKDIEIDCSADKIFLGNEADLYEILGNIIENACKFAKSKVKVQVRGKVSQTIVIEDDGVGMDESQVEAVLERGMRIDESNSGAGIGLAIARDIIRLYGGSISLENSELGGLKVVVHLPIE